MSIDTLTTEQRGVFHELLQGHSIALLGAAGCGKSYLLSIIYNELPAIRKRMDKYNDMFKCNIQLCALTGCAALLLGNNAKTVHSWAGIGLGKGTVDELHLKIKKNAKAKRNWVSTDILIIDEISMMTAELLDKLNSIAKLVRRCDKPFGGIQLLLVGDFYQLPPVNKNNDQTMFAFESDTWKEAIKYCIELTVIQRQKDPVFQEILTEARVGALSKKSCKTLQSYQLRDWKANKIHPTLLFPRRAEVDMINDSNLKALIVAAQPKHNYTARFIYDPKKLVPSFSEKNENFQRAVASMDADAAYMVELELVQEAQVMLIANVDPTVGLINGSRGIIVGFCSVTTYPIVEFVNGIRRIMGPHVWSIEGYPFVSRAQIPFRLAWATTIHKAQGSSLDCALVDIGSNNFEYGQAYVALSRVRSVEALFIYDFDPSVFRVHPKVRGFYKNIVVHKVEEYPEFTDEKVDVVNIVNVEEPGKEVVEEAVAVEAVAVEEVSVEEAVAVEEPGVVNTDSISSTNWLYDSIPENWKEYLHSQQENLQKLSTLLDTKEFLPPREQIWSALEYTPISSIKVVILGQDPYPTPGNAHGLAFSILPDVKMIPASLKNIYKEMASDLHIPNDRKTGYLDSWAKQGVLLLNTVLTVEANAPQSHSKLGWECITDHLIQYISAKLERVVFVLWGKSAQTKKQIIGSYLDNNKHKVFESAHPSPLSASKGFFGSRPFSTINNWLTEMGHEQIIW